MQTSTQTAPPADVAPALAPALPAPVTVTTVGPDGRPQTLAIPRSTEEVEALLAQRQELAGQLTNVSQRRSALAAELGETHEPAARTGLESRLALLDQRIIQIETDLAGIGRQLSAAPAEFVALAEVSGSPGDSEYEQGLMAGGFTGLALALVVGFVARRAWKRRTRTVPAQLSADAGQRLERLEHGMDAIALEIERISEGQRFVTKLLSDSQSPIGQPQRLAKAAHAEREDPAKR
jgi:hypothetical protein